MNGRERERERGRESHIDKERQRQRQRKRERKLKRDKDRDREWERLRETIFVQSKSDFHCHTVRGKNANRITKSDSKLYCSENTRNYEAWKTTGLHGQWLWQSWQNGWFISAMVQQCCSIFVTCDFANNFSYFDVIKSWNWTKKVK